MRAISLVNKLEFQFKGNVVRNALTLADVDNDGCNELIVGNQLGDVAIFKGQQKIQTISKLSFITCIGVGDVLNEGRNVLVIITGDGWCYIYATPKPETDKSDDEVVEGVEQVDGQIQSTSRYGSVETSRSGNPPSKPGKSTKEDHKAKVQLVRIHKQRIPANAKNLLVGDVDGDGMIEMVIGLTDRVVRSYRWIVNDPDKPFVDVNASLVFDNTEKLLGQFVALNKWECANQIGSITLHHSWEGIPSLLVAQPGGTFMRITCTSDESLRQTGIENSANSSGSSERIPGFVEYQSLGISRMRNQNISTEILGDLDSSKFDKYDKRSTRTPMGESSKSATKGRPYAVATLDGTIMLVQDEVILWAIAVDHQIFALTKLDVNGNGSDDIVACSWDGQTYILDQEKNSVRFHLDEPVQAFDSGYYNLKKNEPAVTCLAYVTFKNSVLIYYDIPLKEFICKKFEPDPELLSQLFISEGRTPDEAMEIVRTMDKKTKKELVEYLLYKS